MAAGLPLIYSPGAAGAGTLAAWAPFCVSIEQLRLANELTGMRDAPSLDMLFGSERCDYSQTAVKMVVTKVRGSFICFKVDAAKWNPGDWCWWANKRDYRP